jgi:excisionase family DNA binding protein
MARLDHFGHPAQRALLAQEPSSVGFADRKALAMTTRTPDAEPLLTPAEVATMFRVDPKTVTRWAKAGKLTSIRTLGGHRRYRESEVRALLAGIPQQRSDA